jgi:hypothetical protein
VSGVALSVAAGYRGDLDGALATLEAALPPGVALLLGGAGAQGAQTSGQIVNRFEDLFHWATALSRR